MIAGGDSEFLNRLSIIRSNKIINRITSWYSKPSTDCKIWQLYEDQDKTLWIGHSEGIHYLLDGDTTIRALNGPIAKWRWEDEVTSYQIRAKDKSTLWVCADSKLWEIDIKDKTITKTYSSEEGTPDYLPGGRFHFMHTDQKEIHWLAMKNSLLRWDPKSNTKRLYTNADGLPTNELYAISEDNFGYHWISSRKGLIRFHKESEIVEVFYKKHGISHNEFNRASFYNTKDSQVFFGGLNGVTSFHPNNFPNRIEISDIPLLLNKVEKYNKKAGLLKNRESIYSHGNEVVFDPDDQFLSFDFSLLDYGQMEQVSYAWNIDGISDQWTYQPENTLKLYSLPYGKHVLQIKGKSAKYGWSADILEIIIVVTKPFYLTWWFLSLCFVAGISSVFLYFDRRNKKLREAKKSLEHEVKLATNKILKDKLLIEEQAEELRELDKAKTTFFTNISHELRTPLTLIMGPLENVLSTHQKIEPSLQNTLEVSLSNAKKLKGRVDEILDLSKLESGKLTLSLTVVPSQSFVQGIVASFTPLCESLGIDIAYTSYLTDDITVSLDQKKTEKIIGNLLSNAIKYYPKNGIIRLAISQDEDNYVVKVSDQGTGISPDDLKKIFDRFYQSSTGNQKCGTGVGLPLSSDLAKLMNGSLSAENNSDQGASFIFKFHADISDVAAPLESQYIANPVRYQSQTKQSLTLKTEKVLIVEDNLQLRHYIKSILEIDYNVLEAGDGLEALALLDTENIDLITCDVMMPNTNGFKFLEKIKSNKVHAQIPIIMLTSLADTDNKLEALQAGVDDYLIKPLYAAELEACVGNLLANLQLRKQSKQLDEEPLMGEKKLWITRLKKYIISELDNTKLNRASVAFHLNTTEKTLDRHLKKQIGLSLTNYIKEIRLSSARKLLDAGSTKSIKQISFEHEYSSPDYFSKEFYKRFGKKVSEYLN